MLELSENVNNGLFRKFKLTYDALISKRIDHKIEEVADGIEDYIEFATNVDREFVELIGRLLSNNRAAFDIYAGDLDDLISKYFNAVRSWNLYEAEIFIEQIFAIACRNDELLAKVGYCIKHRLANHYHYLDVKTNGIQRLNVARDSRNYDAYRQSCLQIIRMMSPNKLLITNFANQILLT